MGSPVGVQVPLPAPRLPALGPGILRDCFAALAMTEGARMPDDVVVIKKSSEMAPVETRREGLYERLLLSEADSLRQNVVLFDAHEGMEVEYHGVVTGESLFIMSGIHEVILEDRRETLTAGDIVYFPPGSGHGMKCIEPGQYLAVFAPSKAALRA
jgi:quercetin dioxygenase-like cupin family protein